MTKAERKRKIKKEWRQRRYCGVVYLCQFWTGCDDDFIGKIIKGASRMEVTRRMAIWRRREEEGGALEQHILYNWYRQDANLTKRAISPDCDWRIKPNFRWFPSLTTCKKSRTLCLFRLMAFFPPFLSLFPFPCFLSFFFLLVNFFLVSFFFFFFVFCFGSVCQRDWSFNHQIERVHNVTFSLDFNDDLGQTLFFFFLALGMYPNFAKLILGFQNLCP